ncbi:MAG: chemotaxis protein [Lachnospiraceae bacterium]|jgi:two-component system chemotaxis response regulator CheV|nr:chemotaxis protein [Lachnospiraceae bacterium]MEE3460411.1 chemotaxis protein [Lachnospiraceae bacterium]
MAKDKGILLESGTNELEILEFTVGGNYYGINVAKIREVMKYQELTTVPNAHPFIEGAFNTRGETISIIDLARCLNLPESDDPSNDMMLITSFNEVNTGFHVTNVVGIYRVNWANIIEPDTMLNSGHDSVITGIVHLNDTLILMIDFEKIVSEISPEAGINLNQVRALGKRDKNNKPILYAEDSQFLRRLISNGLNDAGFTNVTSFSNGLDLWNYLQNLKNEGTVEKEVRCVVTDIEMPKMDGHRLLKLMREDPDLKDIPVIIFSSLIDDEMYRKGESLGANAQLSKSEMGEFILKLDELLAAKRD